MKIIKNIIVLIAISLSMQIFSQELLCEVDVISPKIKSSPENVQIFEALKKSIMEFMNNTRWTESVFEGHEKIECSILITIDEKVSSKKFKGSIQVQSRRPVYNSNYNTPLLNIVDKNFDFDFERNTQIIFSPNSHQSNLSSVLAYYAYVILGLDFDSFSLEGGSDYFLKAQQIVTNAQMAAEAGWKASENQRNRYWFVENMLHQSFKPLRKSMYEYHRLGLDLMYDSPDKMFAVIQNVLKNLDQVHRIKPVSFNAQQFFIAKYSEIIKILKEASLQEKNASYQMLRKLDPAHLQDYQDMMKS